MFWRLRRFGEWRLNLVLRLGSFWLGVHYSKSYGSFCIAPLPCVVFQFIKNDSVPADCKVIGEGYAWEKGEIDKKSSKEHLWY